MEFHESKLTLLCRLCGGKITLSRGYSEARAASSELKEFIQHAYTIKCEQICPISIHHMYICNKCLHEVVPTA